MKKAEVIGPSIGDGLTSETAFRPAISADYTILRMRDVTSRNEMPTDPNLYSVEIVCDDVVMVAIQADPKYQVLWIEEE